MKKIMKFLERKIYSNLEDAARYKKEKSVTKDMVTKIVNQLTKKS